MIRVAGVLAILGALAGSGCTWYSEKYYVGVTSGKWGDQMEPAQYYQFELSGYAYCQRTEFQSGWYDRDAVDVLFSEIVTETSKRNVATGGAVAPTVATKPLPAPGTTSDAKYVVFGPEGERRYGESKRFVIIAASNPKAIADEIQSFAESQDLSTMMTDLIQHQEKEAAVSAQYAVDKEAARQRAFLSDLKDVREQLTTLKAAPAGVDAARLLSEIDRLIKALPK